jgi:hypothetical protein
MRTPRWNSSPCSSPFVIIDYGEACQKISLVVAFALHALFVGQHNTTQHTSQPSS